MKIHTLAKSVFIASILFLTGNLTGCAHLNSNFDCPRKPGVMCQSIDQTNAQVDQGKLGGFSPAPLSGCKSCQSISFNNPYDPVRHPETTLRVWLAPYEDKSGTYYQANFFYTVIKPGQWQGQPVKAINAEGEPA